MSYKNRVVYKLFDLLSEFPKLFVPNYLHIRDGKSQLSLLNELIQFVDKHLVVFALRMYFLTSDSLSEYQLY